MKRTVTLTFLCALFVVCAPLRSAAEPFAISFTAVVNEISYGEPLLTSFNVRVGSVVTGEIAWDTEAFAALAPNATSTGSSYQRNLSMIFKVGESSYESHPDLISYGSSLSGQKLNLDADFAINTTSSPYPDWASLAFLASETLPSLHDLMQDFDPELFGSGSLRVGQEAGAGRFNYRASVTEVRQVPEPSSWMLVIFAIGATLPLVRRMHRAAETR